MENNNDISHFYDTNNASNGNNMGNIDGVNNLDNQNNSLSQPSGNDLFSMYGNTKHQPETQRPSMKDSSPAMQYNGISSEEKEAVESFKSQETMGKNTPVIPSLPNEVQQDLNTNNNGANHSHFNSSNPINQNTSSSSQQASSFSEEFYKASNVSSNKKLNFEENDTLIEKFIGKNYQKIKKDIFNIPAFFFAEIYLFYRKMFLYGLLCFLLRWGLIFLSLGDFQVILNVILAFAVNKIYIQFAKRKINKMHRYSSNIGQQELEKLCVSKGGTSIGLVFGGFFLEMVTSICILLICLFLGFQSIFGGFSQIIQQIISGPTEEYSGALFFSAEANVFDDFEIVMPAGFENNSDENTFMGSIRTDFNEVFSSCSVTFAGLEGTTSSKDYAQEMANYYKSSLSTVSKNGINWYYFEIPSDLDTTKYYLAEKNNRVYAYEFIMEEDANQIACENYNTEIINSIRFK